MSGLVAGDRVLAAHNYEPLLGFLHEIRSQPTESLTVVHARGEFRASANHIVFVNAVDTLVANVQAGDYVTVGDVKSIVLSVLRSIGSHGMFSPLLPSGTIVVDGVRASNYAGSSGNLFSPHGTAHVIAFPARMFYGFQRVLGFSQTQKYQPADVEELLRYLRSGRGPLSDLQSWLVAL